MSPAAAVQLLERGLGLGLVLVQDVAGAALRRLVELGGVRVVVRLDLVVRDVRQLDAVVVEHLLHHFLDHHLTAHALDVGLLLLAALLGFEREQLEAHHVVQELAASLRAAVARAQVGRLIAEPVGELAERDRGVADLGEHLRWIARRSGRS